LLATLYTEELKESQYKLRTVFCKTGQLHDSNVSATMRPFCVHPFIEFLQVTYQSGQVRRAADINPLPLYHMTSIDNLSILMLDLYAGLAHSKQDNIAAICTINYNTRSGDRIRYFS
jgi:hypothetical protein